MGFVNIYYKILEKGNTKDLMNNRKHDTTIFHDWDNDSLQHEIKNNKYYYKVKFIKYPKIGIDIDKLFKWSIQNNYQSHATQEEKLHIKWDGTKKDLLGKKMGVGIILRKRLIRWVESKQVINSNTGLLTSNSPIIPSIRIFYKIIDYGTDRYEWIFQHEIYNTKIYNYMLLK
jgi:hypothetical protein